MNFGAKIVLFISLLLYTTPSFSSEQPKDAKSYNVAFSLKLLSHPKIHSRTVCVVDQSCEMLRSRDMSIWIDISSRKPQRIWVTMSCLYYSCIFEDRNTGAFVDFADRVKVPFFHGKSEGSVMKTLEWSPMKRLGEIELRITAHDSAKAPAK